MQIRRFNRPVSRGCLAHARWVLLGVILSGTATGQVQLGIALEPQPVITVSGPGGTIVEVQWSDSFTDPGRWFYLTNRILASAVQVVDPSPAEARARFYRTAEVPDAGMVLVPGGSFAMGDTFSEGFPYERPVHGAAVSPFYMERTEVTRNTWDNVYLWAVANGYGFDNVGGGKGPTHPAQWLNWYDAVKWCNARSQMDGLTPAYYTEAAQTNVYRAGRSDLSRQMVRWSANGYRLPTEAEWERAARSGTNGLRYPWGGSIDLSRANYLGVEYLLYDLSGGVGYHPDYETGDFPYTSPVGSFPPTDYGLHDLVGNVWEWCWDRFDPSWYSNSVASQMDTPGSPGPTTNRVMRGGSWADDASFGRCANRAFPLFQSPTSADFTIGFRCVRVLPGFLSPALLDDAAALPDGRHRFTMYNLTPGKTNILEASTTLLAWTPIATNVPVMATLNFTNTPGLGEPARFYRSRQLP